MYVCIYVCMYACMCVWDCICMHGLHTYVNDVELQVPIPAQNDWHVCVEFYMPTYVYMFL